MLYARENTGNASLEESHAESVRTWLDLSGTQLTSLTISNNATSPNTFETRGAPLPEHCSERWLVDILLDAISHACLR